MSNDSTSKTLTVAFLLCLVCSIIVSTAAVSLRPTQELNKQLDKQKNILAAAGLLEDDVDVAAAFENIETRYVELASGEYVDKKDYVQRKAAKDPALSIKLSDDQDIASIRRRANVAEVYLAKNEQGEINTVIFPVHGYGLWSTLYGFLALETDVNTVVGLGFYEHAETPGLGGEVDNPKWRALWPGKKIYDENGKAALGLIKGKVINSTKASEHKVDGLSGASLTSNGVTNLVRFWMGDDGFGPYIESVKARGL